VPGRELPAEHLDQSAGLGLGLRGRLCGRFQRIRHAVPVGGRDPLPGAGLHDHNAEAVGDDVVQFPGDPRPLVADGFAGE
jgi:hypothetical protein